MYFILSKVLLFILYPFMWVLVLLLISAFTKYSRLKKRSFIAALIILYVFSCPVLLNLVANAWNINKVPQLGNRKYSCAIVLGGFSSIDKDGKGYFNSAADRFIQGMRLLSMGKVSRLMITGGNGTLAQGGFREGPWAKSQLEDLKYPDSLILIESQSRNTMENAAFSKTILQKAHLQPPYLLVTSDFHIRRAMMIFKKEGYNVIAYPCNFFGPGKTSFDFDSFMPAPYILAAWGTYTKEMFGYWVDNRKLKQEPVFTVTH